MLAARTRPIALLALLAPTPAVASTLTFDGIEAFFNELTAPHPGDKFGWAGTYFEGAYAVDVFANAASREVRDGQLGISDGSGVSTLFSDVAIRRTDGQSFILESFEISAGRTNYFAHYTYFPAGSDEPEPEQRVPLRWPMLELVGSKTDGSTVAERLSPWRGSIDTEATVSWGVSTSDPASPFYAADLALPFTTTDFGTSFRDLLELRVNLVRPLALDELFCSSVNLARVDPAFAAVSSCSLTDPLSGFATSPDGGVLEFFFVDGGRNDIGYIYIDRIAAPIPLPPAMLLMLAGLGALLGIGWRRA
jgi:hypothetical protein